MAEIKWIKITTNMFEDEKIDFIESLPDGDAIIVIWIKLLAMAGKCNAEGFIFLTEKIPYTEDMLAHKFKKPLPTIKLALETFAKLEMIHLDDEGFLCITNWSKHQNVHGMDKIREQGRQRVAKYREAKRIEKTSVEECNGNGNAGCNVTCNVTVTDGNTDVTQQNKNKNKNNIYNNIGDFVTDVTDGEISEKTKSGTSQKDIDDFFEEVWSEYPNKKGKASVSAKTKKALFKLGKEKVLQAIERYKEYVASEHERGFDLQYKHGSSFFNSGYLDYIEEQSDAPPKSERAAPLEQSADNIVPFVSTTQEPKRERYTETGERILTAQEWQEQLEAERIAKKRAELMAEGIDPDDLPFDI